jgi:hypothetical protein
MFAARIEVAKFIMASFWFQLVTFKPDATAVTICLVWSSTCGEVKNRVTDWLMAKDALFKAELALLGRLRKLEFQTLKKAV